MKYRMAVLVLLICFRSFSQTQTCPVNINFATGNLTHWFAYTGNNAGGNGPSAIMQRYDSTTGPPAGTIGAVSIHEYNLASVTGIQVNNSTAADPFGGFAKVPKINGY